MKAEKEIVQFRRVCFTPRGKRVTARLYWVWCCMRKRCNCKTFRDYKFYGGRGISVCKEWDDYAAFRAWAISSGYRKGLTLERDDNDGDYKPSNCRWTTMAEQNRNSSRIRLMTLNGVTLPRHEWAKRTGLSRDLIACRMLSGWSDERALTVPKQEHFSRKHSN